MAGNIIAYKLFNTDTGRWQIYSENFEILTQSNIENKVDEVIKTRVSNRAILANVISLDQLISISYDKFKEKLVEHKKNNIPKNSSPEKIKALNNFSIEERFEFIVDFTEMIANKDANSLIISGDPGCGKTYTVMNTLKNLGMINALDLCPEDVASVADQADFTVIGGNTTAKGLYKILYKFKEKFLIFDDCDKVLDKTCKDLLNKALDTSDKRYISWNAELSKDSDVPTSFQFEGGVIFNTNKPLEELESALQSRSYRIDVHMTIPEKLERMKTILPHISGGYTNEMRNEVMQFIEERAFLCTELSMRTLIKVLNIRLAKPNKWIRMAEYQI